MFGRKIVAGALAAATALALAAAPASADHPGVCDGPALRHVECPEPPEQLGEGCPDTYVLFRIAERRPRSDAKFQTVTVAATNSNQDTSGAFDAWLVVTYQANRWSSIEQQVIPPTIVADGGGTYTASFAVPRFRDVDGLVRASIEDIGCDRSGEAVSLS